jgi:tRNA threonylcarbamoyladenosine biosynthesis protein TsaE
LAGWKALEGRHVRVEASFAEDAQQERRGRGEGVSMDRLNFTSPNEHCSLMLGARIGQQAEAGDVLALWGELGSGKTLFARGIAQGMGVPQQVPVTSPTFTIINEYEGRLRLYHLDLYRLTTIEELETLPWREVIYGTGVAVIEWPDRMGRLLPENRWDITIEFLDEDRRVISLAAHGDSQETRLARLAPELSAITWFQTDPHGEIR